MLPKTFRLFRVTSFYATIPVREQDTCCPTLRRGKVYIVDKTREGFGVGKARFRYKDFNTVMIICKCNFIFTPVSPRTEAFSPCATQKGISDIIRVD